MTPCAARDGRYACTAGGLCVGCGEHAADLLADLVPKYVALRARVADLEFTLEIIADGCLVVRRPADERRTEREYRLDQLADARARALAALETEGGEAS
jgi:hypothetical protein